MENYESICEECSEPLTEEEAEKYFGLCYNCWWEEEYGYKED